MGVELEQQHARVLAARTIEEFGIDAPEHIRLEDLAWALGAEIVVGDLDGAAARLTRNGDRAVIRVSKKIDNEGHRRFSVAHELGHLVLKHPGDHVVLCAEGDLHDFGGKRAVREAAANAFAAELLMPAVLARKRCEVSPVHFNLVRGLAADFKTSLTAAAIRFVQLTSERCALVYSEDGCRRWFARSENFWPFLEIGQALSPSSLADDFFKKGVVPDRSETIDADAWSTAAAEKGLEEIREHSVALPSLNAVLSLLWIPER